MEQTLYLLVQGTEEEFDSLMEAMNIDDQDVEASEYLGDGCILYWVHVKHQIERAEAINDVQAIIDVKEILN